MPRECGMDDPWACDEPWERPETPRAARRPEPEPDADAPDEVTQGTQRGLEGTQKNPPPPPPEHG